MSAEQWKTIHDEVEAWADKAERLLNAQGSEAWREFAGKSCDGSAGLGHRLSKPLRVWEHEDPTAP